MPWASLMNWWNFIFALPLAVGILLGVLFVLTGIIDTGDLSAGDHADAHGGDLHADAHGGDTSTGGEPTEGTADHTGDDHSSLLDFVKVFGVGTGVPITVLLPTLMMVWGIVGLGMNQLLQPLLKLPALYAPLSAVLAVGGMALFGQLAGFVARRLGLFDTTPAPTRHDLVGCSGYAVYSITETEGTANIKSHTGDILRVSCRTHPGHPPIPAGTELLVVGYNEAEGDYFVEPHPFSIPSTETTQMENEQTEQTQTQGR